LIDANCFDIDCIIYKTDAFLSRKIISILPVVLHFYLGIEDLVDERLQDLIP
jgi:hypothetical protein